MTTPPPPFHTVLIANRGEIACRVIRTCRRMGIRTVAVYSEADAAAPHVAQADEAWCVGPAPASESYLNTNAILETCRRSGAQAVHPGYGFLAENAGFARACGEAGLVFVGPSPHAIARMGDKVTARALASEASVPLAPGSPGAVTDEEALALAAEIGFPLMVKAAAGGGGIGLKVARSRDELGDILRSTRSLAEGAFGSGTVFLERFVERGAHVEVQVLADAHGNVLHLGERDCSAQRRHQKVVEETPSPRLTPELRTRMTRAAVGLARHLGYTNAGTVEFLVDDDRRFYFLEVNTRIQVEHPVTEMVTGVDLVELQLRIAAGEPLPLRQEDVRFNGHALEARVYAEEPQTLLPSSGRVRGLAEPDDPYLRVDSGIAEGYEVSPYYDPMLAKLISWGVDREEGLERLEGALDGYRLDGPSTNVPLLKDILRDGEFRRGTYHTDLVERVVQERAAREREARQLAAAVATALAVEMQRRRRQMGSGAERDGTSRWKLEGRRRLMQGRLPSPSSGRGPGASDGWRLWSRDR